MYIKKIKLNSEISMVISTLCWEPAEWWTSVLTKLWLSIPLHTGEVSRDCSQASSRTHHVEDVRFFCGKEQAGKLLQAVREKLPHTVFHPQAVSIVTPASFWVIY